MTQAPCDKVLDLSVIVVGRFSLPNPEQFCAGALPHLQGISVSPWVEGGIGGGHVYLAMQAAACGARNSARGLTQTTERFHGQGCLSQ